MAAGWQEDYVSHNGSGYTGDTPSDCGGGAGTPGEKAAAENKQSDEAKVDIPDFLTIRDMQEALQRENIGNIFDQEMDKDDLIIDGEYKELPDETTS